MASTALHLSGRHSASCQLISWHMTTPRHNAELWAAQTAAAGCSSMKPATLYYMHSETAQPVSPDRHQLGRHAATSSCRRTLSLPQHVCLAPAGPVQQV